MNVIILGCGPAGLMAAHGAVHAGAGIKIISTKRKSELFGAQYLHAPIPDISDGERVQVKYLLTGSPDEYRHKVYGDTWDGTVSAEDLDTDHDAWNIREAYDRLWEQYHRDIFDVQVVPSIIASLADSADIVISTIPRPALCTRGHTFGSADIYAAGDAPERGVRIPYTAPDNTVICSGHADQAWYRLSNVFGMHTVEWPGSLKMPPPVSSAAMVRKPTYHNCDCNPRLAYAGRYGTWEKGVLSHTAYFQARELVLDAQNRMEGLET